MRYFICDKCSYPMDRHSILEIDGRQYEICDKCRDDILRELKNKSKEIGI